MKAILIFLIASLMLFSCVEKNAKVVALSEPSDYKGTASITQGPATTTQKDVFQCERGRPTDIGTIQSLDGKEWNVPAETNFQDKLFPFAADLYNPCNGNTYASAKEALSKINTTDIVEIDESGELFNAYIFADNYFEMYVNGIPVGKDKVPFTEFNSSIVQFRAEKPFTIAMKLVDWEEHLGLGAESNRGKAYHAGDGGMVAVIKDSDDNIVAVSNDKWKAQTFYSAPITDVTCSEELGNYRYSKNCDESGGQDLSSAYALHWDIPSDWMQPDFDDSAWPNATTYTNKTIGVDNKPAYTNFSNIFDDKTNDAQFIWSTNVVLDNEVLVRYEVQ